jgi:hypothetical protein
MNNIHHATTKPRSKTYRLRRLLSRYSLLWVLAGAAIATAALLLQGRTWIATLKGTPLPGFYLEDSLIEKPILDKTKVYQSSLSTTRYPGFDNNQAPVKSTAWWNQPKCQAVVNNFDSVVNAEKTLVANKLLSTNKKKTSRRRRVAKSKEVVSPDTLPVSLFQTVKAQDTFASAAGKQFVACQVHGDQELSGQQRIVLRLSEPLQLNNQSYAAGTLLYGSVQFSMDRMRVTISRVGELTASFQVHDHTYHEGILLQQKDQRLEQATTEAALQEAGRTAQQLPSRAGITLAQNLLIAARRRPNTIFLPDGFPLYIAQVQTTNTP